MFICRISDIHSNIFLYHSASVICFGFASELLTADRYVNEAFAKAFPRLQIPILLFPSFWKMQNGASLHHSLHLLHLEKRF